MPKLVQVLEPALAIENGEQLELPTVNVKSVEKEDVVCFPHLDTCLGIVFILEDGTKLASHLSQTSNLPPYDFAFEENLNASLKVMNSLRKNAKIDTVYFVYNSTNWNAPVNSVQFQFPKANVIKKCTDESEKFYPHGADVFVYNDKATLYQSPKSSKGMSYEKLAKNKPYEEEVFPPPNKAAKFKK